VIFDIKYCGFIIICGIPVFMDFVNGIKTRNLERRPSWPWSYGSWIYHYLCNQCLSPLKLWVRTPFMAMCTQCS